MCVQTSVRFYNACKENVDLIPLGRAVKKARTQESVPPTPEICEALFLAPDSNEEPFLDEGHLRFYKACLALGGPTIPAPTATAATGLLAEGQPLGRRLAMLQLLQLHAFARSTSSDDDETKGVEAGL